MKCASCGSENPSNIRECEMCGMPLGKRETIVEGAAAPNAPLANPHQKRRTVFDPEAPPAAPDFLTAPPPPRPPIDRDDPFGIGAATPAVAKPPPSPPPAAEPARPKGRTMIEAPSPDMDRIRGVLFEYRGNTSAIHPLRGGRNTIGRDPDCYVHLTDGQVSNQHAYIFIRALDATFMDASSNGSKVDQQFIHGDQIALKNHSVIWMGESKFIFVMVPEQELQQR